MGHGRVVRVLMGPTASGKSALALDVARKHGDVILNADAMQMYRDMAVLTARPTVAEMQEVPHAMYGMWAAHVHGTAALWVSEAARQIEALFTEGKRVLVVGGTGMYVRALMEGLAPIPPVPAPVRDEVRALYTRGGTQAVREALMSCDPAMAEKLHAGDTQRNMRALEVFHATGKSIAHWQAMEGQAPLKDVEFRVYTLQPEREEVYARIDRRFGQMMEMGALREVERLLAMGLPEHLPVMKVIGVQELGAYLRGDMALEAAVDKARQHSRNYAKRQMTWIRQQLAQARDGAELLTET